MPDPIAQSDPGASYYAHREEIDEAVSRVLESGWYLLGKELKAFEQEFASYLGAKHCIGVASGTDALVIAMRACGLGAGDVVITVSHTAVATVAAIELAGAIPLLVDIDPATFTIDPESIEDALMTYRGEGRIKAIIPVHLYGHPANVQAIVEICRRHGLKVIEDCAQSNGAMAGGQKVGTFGDIGAFSFYPTKNLGAMGDGGAVITPHVELAERARMLREYGWQERYVSSVAGMNSRLDEIQAAILRVKLKWLDIENARRRQIARAYDENLVVTSLTLPQQRGDVSHVYHQYVIRCGRRDDLRSFLQSRAIGTLVHYPVPIHLQPAYLDRIAITRNRLPVTEVAARQVLSLPMHPHLTDGEIERVCEAIKKWS
ncbi:MAG: DegT/DnrJ/EryC1/StrS family aminotransferase [Acidobacteria bacterium]|nr:DegT/DnrJ/EryC1/StrS family aminotransferase [Acidobacteriota bacterium]